MCGAIATECDTNGCQNFTRYSTICNACVLLKQLKEEKE